MKRACFVLKVKRERLQEYKARHAQVWPAMLDALREAGWRNYSLFLSEEGMLIGYVETTDFALAVSKMQQSPVNAAWQADMADFFEDLDKGAADRSMAPLEEVFHLD